MHQITAANPAELEAVVDEALCAETDPDLFFTPGLERAARALCRDCPIRLECAGYALEHGVEGVWGGLTVSDRRRIWREHGRGRYNPYASAGHLGATSTTPEAIAKRHERARAAA